MLWEPVGQVFILFGGFSGVASSQFFVKICLLQILFDFLTAGPSRHVLFFLMGEACVGMALGFMGWSITVTLAAKRGFFGGRPRPFLEALFLFLDLMAPAPIFF